MSAPLCSSSPKPFFHPLLDVRCLPSLTREERSGAVGSRGGQDLEGVVSLRPAGSPTPILALASGLFPLPSHHPHPRERW